MDNNEQIKQFCTNIKKIIPKDLPSYLEEAKTNVKICIILKNYYMFIINNNGRKPDINSISKREKITALLYEKYVSNGLIEDVSEQIITNDEYSFRLRGEVLKNIIKQKYENALIKNIILKRADFLYKNQRKPLSNSPNIQEKLLADQFNEHCMKNLNDSEIAELNKLFNSTKYLTNTAIQYARNKKMEEIDNEK